MTGSDRLKDILSTQKMLQMLLNLSISFHSNALKAINWEITMGNFELATAILKESRIAKP